MPEIEIRPATAQDIPALVGLDHHYTSEWVWQMDVQPDEGLVQVNFRTVHLPRSVKVEYPRSPYALSNDWISRDGLLVALLQGELVAYASLMLNLAPQTSWITDLVVKRSLRRQGIASALLFAAHSWADQHASRRLVLEMQPKNWAAINLAQKFGFEFCGYNDRYYANNDIGLFFAKGLW